MWGITPADWLYLTYTVAWLVLLEGLLSGDNALVLAVMVRHLPKAQQKRALRYGIVGAFAFRLFAVAMASQLLEYWLLKVVGGAYLLYLALSHLWASDDGHLAGGHSRLGKGFWGTVIGVELADIAFSIDSILAAVAMADKLSPRLGAVVLARIEPIGWALTIELAVVYIGGILGIITMRYVAGYFIVLLERFQGLARGAYFLVGWIGLNLVGSGLENALHPKPPLQPGPWVSRLPGWASEVPLEMPEWLFWGGMGLILVVSLIWKPSAPTPDDALLVEAVPVESHHQEIP